MSARHFAFTSLKSLSNQNIVCAAGSGGQQQTGGGVSAPPPSQGSGPSVPFLPAGNPDNFLVLYSRMVYNIVDG